MLAHKVQAAQQRRLKLCHMMAADSLAIVRAATHHYRNNDVEHPWRQDSNFDYLTAIDEAQSIAIIKNTNPIQFIVFCQRKDAKTEAWDGARLGCQAICAHYGANAAYELQQLPDQMPQLLENVAQIYYDWGQDPSFDQQLKGWLDSLTKKARQGINAANSIHFLSPLLGELRLLKDATEIANIRRATAISAYAHRQAMLKAQTAQSEKQVADWLEYCMFDQGAERLAFGSIVASGANACTLHYRDNKQALQSQQLMLIDAGAEYHGYASDISTCFPLSGRFSTPQKAIYNAVLQAQQHCIEACRPGVSLHDLQNIAIRQISQSLLSLGLLQGSLEEIIEKKHYQRFYMHSIGHWLGRDVHDVGSYFINGDWRPLQANMLITIEPGIYIRDDKDIPAPYHNLGVRIEDTILITNSGYENLSADLPRQVADIETFLARATPS